MDYFDGNLKLKMVKFDIMSTIKSIIDITNFRANLLNVKIDFEANFSSNDDQGRNDLLNGTRMKLKEDEWETS